MHSEVVQNLLVLLAGAALINTGFAAALWRSTRDPLFRMLFVAWASVIASALLQSALTQNHLAVTLGFASVFVNNAAFAQLLASVAEVAVPWRRLVLLLGGGLACSVLAAAAGAPFVVVAGPTAVAVAAPSLAVGLDVIRHRWTTLHAQGRALALACILFSAHNLDYVFLRGREGLAPVGFTVAFLVIFAISISAPAALLEVVTKRQARLAAQIEIARTLQARLVPPDSRLERFEFACHMRQADSVGGDYLHHFETEDSEWFFAGDVVGHGFHSGLLALMAHSALSSIIEARPEVSPRELNHLVNRVLWRNLAQLEDRRFMTIVAIRRDARGDRLVVSGCHEDLLVYRAASKEVQTLEVQHLPLGVGFTPDLPLERIGDATLELRPGDLVFVGTDGVFEAARHGRHELGLFGPEPVVELLSRCGDEPLGELRRRLVERLDEFTDGRYADDVAFFMLRARAPGAPA
ncbi:PP2C family protein-serine/threonine phosphatase [Anaeromyxobacter sp. Fw109-5]|uniref:PP2C family protein-serine/threonine phosphatase n=1 Tax=Anaeromyxobacter sp. (strain Fw109-5) TaxID=404589 RepID=UPI0000ED7B9C|nr:PP2C family protein-serine/threonine phosphatase [Anaeromyxobacter sp. Fw109-5]ABS24240.1 Stage II sporulation E family protein [Anaeromyxobacter sp. Fw109-5]